MPCIRRHQLQRYQRKRRDYSCAQHAGGSVNERGSVVMSMAVSMTVAESRVRMDVHRLNSTRTPPRSNSAAGPCRLGRNPARNRTCVSRRVLPKLN